MSDVRLSLSVPDREKGAQTVVVTGGSSEYHLIAPSVKAAQDWYCRIQEKTEAYRKLAKQPTRNVSGVQQTVARPYIPHLTVLTAYLLSTDITLRSSVPPVMQVCTSGQRVTT